MELAGIGVDMLEIERMRRALERHPNLARRAFTEEERLYCESTARPAEHYAARFAAREAVLKALGTGFGNGIGLKDVWVSRGEHGRPSAVLEGRAAEVAREQGVREVALSLSLTREVAVANAVAVTDAVRPKVDETPTPAQEMQASFKRARSVIDELEMLQDGIADALEGGAEGPSDGGATDETGE